MDLKIFRQEVNAWLAENCPASMRQPVKSLDDYYWGGRRKDEATTDQKLWFERMYDKGWIVPYWDKKYGGGGLSLIENKIIEEEMIALGCRKPLFSFGIVMLGPALLKFASEAQKQKYLPPIVKGEIRWCQGYSEPGAGSDLAGLQMKAEDKGDHYLVNGQKIWTSYAHKSDFIFCLVRTDSGVKKHHGISFLLIDMASTGISVSPIKLISGKSPFCETFFDNVRVPKENLVGEQGQGWTIAKYLLTHERQSIGEIGESRDAVDLAKFAKDHIGIENKTLSNAFIRAQLAQFELDEALFTLSMKRAIDEAKAGNNSGALSSFFKYYGTELNKRRYELMLSIRGCNGLVWEGDDYNNGLLARTFLRTKGNSIEGGTSEIQLNIISKRILGLPTI